jgi:hypothetical protein
MCEDGTADVRTRAEGTSLWGQRGVGPPEAAESALPLGCSTMPDDSDPE